MTDTAKTTEQEQWVLVITGDWNIMVDPAVCRLALLNSVPEDEPDADLHDFLGNASDVYEVSAMLGVVEACEIFVTRFNENKEKLPAWVKVFACLVKAELSDVHPAPAEGDKG